MGLGAAGWKTGTFKAPTSIDRHLAGIVVTARQKYRLTLDRRVGAEARIRIPALFCQRQNSGRTGLDDHYSPVS
ncbi:hypothetical protein ACIPYQ_09115 [Streptomyces sp. NPDC090045]|uniref:hypothetical protein n=1 Tax=Streptomyces sp. NPDC090045 TaxID=3365927 RepID=UPI00380A6B9A